MIARPPIPVTVLDNGLRSTGEHSYAIARALRGELARRGSLMESYAHRDVDGAVQREIGCVPHFSRGLYEGCQATAGEQRWRNVASRLAFRSLDYGPSEKETSRVLNRAFAEDLERLPETIWEAGRLVLFPGLMQHQIVGLARFLRAKPVAASIVCQLMFEPTWLPWPRRARMGPGLYRRAFRELGRRAGGPFVFTAENRHVAGVFERRFGLRDIGLLPVPFGGEALAARRTPGTDIGFLGYSKAEKGFHLLPEAIRRCLEAKPDLRFTVQIQHHGQEPAVVEAETALRAMPKIRILEGALDGPTFADVSARLDIVLLPYDPRRFGLRGSGLFVEAVAAGRIVVATRDTWAGRSIEAHEAIGTTFDEYTSGALANAILAECADVPRRRAQAFVKAADSARTHSIRAYVDRLFASSHAAAHG